MALNEIPVTFVGNLTADPDLRFTPTGTAVASFTVASTPRAFDAQSGEWRDGEPTFLRCSIWRQAAENVVETLGKGMRVIVAGRLRQRSYETPEGEKRTVYEVDVHEVGPSLTWATATVKKITRAHANGSQPIHGDDQWATPPVTTAPAAATEVKPPF